jgi:hypothetical protein
MTTRYQWFGALAATILDAQERRRLAVDLHALEQALAALVGERAQHAHGVLALHAEARVHEPVGQVAGVGEEQQPLGVDVQPADRLPLALGQARQAPEDRGPGLRVVVGHDLPGGLVVGQHARRQGADAHLHGLAVDRHAVAEGNALAGVGRVAVHRHPAVHDHLLQVTPGAQPGLRQHLVQLGRIGLGGQHAPAVLGAGRGLGPVLVRGGQHRLGWPSGVCGNGSRGLVGRSRLGGSCEAAMARPSPASTRASTAPPCATGGSSGSAS